MRKTIEEKVAGFPEIINILEYMEVLRLPLDHLLEQVTQESERKQAPREK